MISRKNGALLGSLERLGNSPCVEFHGAKLEGSEGFSWGDVFQEDAKGAQEVKIPLTLAACQVRF